ncbi:MAG: cation diffusion facilitator family transporter [Gammaproteobacteria bacterium]
MSDPAHGVGAHGVGDNLAVPPPADPSGPTGSQSGQLKPASSPSASSQSGAVASPEGAYPEDRYKVIRRVTLIGSALDLVLGVAKIGGGVWAHSQSLIADGVHSLSDLATDILVLIAARHASADADEDHPYGHGRIETAATVALGIALMLVAVGIAYDAVRNLADPQSLVAPHPLALAIAVVSVLSKEAIYHYTMRYSRKIRSNLLRANAWHSRSDAASSLVVIVGVGGSLLGLDYLDAVAAVVVAWMVGRMGFKVSSQGMGELVDKGLEPAEVATIRDTIMGVDGVADLHLLRTRQMAGNAFVDVHIILSDPRVSVSEGHQISEVVRARLLRQIPEVEDVTVHIDPEDDEHAAPAKHLPLRREVLAKLRPAWAGLDAASAVLDVELHYLNGRVDVELTLPLSVLVPSAGALSDAGELRCAFARASAGVAGIGRVSLVFVDDATGAPLHQESADP